MNYPTQDDIEIVPVQAADLLDAIYVLRAEVWNEQLVIPASFSPWNDKNDHDARHWAVLVNKTLVAAARFTVHSTLEDLPDWECINGVIQALPPVPIGSINRLVVDSQFRGKGISRALDAVRLQAAAELGCGSVIACTRGRRIDALLSLGFTVVGVGPRAVHPVFSQLEAPTILIKYL